MNISKLHYYSTPLLERVSAGLLKVPGSNPRINKVTLNCLNIYLRSIIYHTIYLSFTNLNIKMKFLKA